MCLYASKGTSDKFRLKMAANLDGRGLYGMWKSFVLDGSRLMSSVMNYEYGPGWNVAKRPLLHRLRNSFRISRVWPITYGIHVCDDEGDAKGLGGFPVRVWVSPKDLIGAGILYHSTDLWDTRAVMRAVFTRAYIDKKEYDKCVNRDSGS